MKNCKLCGVCPVCVERVRRTVKVPGRVWARAIFVQKRLGNNVICKCGATVDTFADKCTAELSFPCEGFLAIETAREEFRAADKRGGPR